MSPTSRSLLSAIIATMVRVLSTVALLAGLIGAVAGQVSSNFNYSTSACTPVLGELAFSP